MPATVSGSTVAETNVDRRETTDGSASRSARPMGVIRTVRFRTSAGAVGLIALALILAAVGFDTLLGVELRRSFDRSLELQASDRGALIDAGADPKSVTTALGEEQFVVVFDADRTVLAVSGLVDVSEVDDVATGRATDVEVRIFEDGRVESDPERLRVFSVATSAGGLVMVGAEVSGATGPQKSARKYLYLGVPALTVIAALIAWRLVGRALGPVDRIREEVDAMVGAGSGARLSVPGTSGELDRLALTMNDLLDRIDTQTEAQRQFIADASHELKSPVANLRILAETAAEHMTTDEWTVLRSTLVGETERLQVLVDDLLFLARSDESGTRAGVRTVHLDDVIFDEAERTSSRVGEIVVDASRVVPCDVEGDEGQLARVIRNLLDNAAAHARERVSVASSVMGSEVWVIVDDDGPGVAVEDRQRVFERFTRLESARSRRSGGTGLGLAIVDRIVASHGGSVDITDSPLGGARFTAMFSRGGE